MVMTEVDWKLQENKGPGGRQGGKERAGSVYLASRGWLRYILILAEAAGCLPGKSLSDS